MTSRLPVPDIVMPAEWENPTRILLTYPSSTSDWGYIYAEACEQFNRLIESLCAAGEKVLLIMAPGSPLPPHIRKKVELVEDVEFNDTWTRDYGPITVCRLDQSEKITESIQELDFGFNGWGLKFAADKDNLVNLRLGEKGRLDAGRYVNHRDFILEGGSIESDGRGTILTTTRCLCSPNRNGGKSKEEIEKILKENLGAERVLWLDYGFLAGDDTDSHIDTLARMAPDDTIIYMAPPVDMADEHYEEFVTMEKQLRSLRTADGKPYRLIPLPFPDAIYDEEGARLPATYANYLVTGNNIFLPTYNQPDNDAEALERIKEAFPKHRIHTVECSTLIKQHGSLHCSTMQLYH